MTFLCDSNINLLKRLNYFRLTFCSIGFVKKICVIQSHKSNMRKDFGDVFFFFYGISISLFVENAKQTLPTKCMPQGKILSLPKVISISGRTCVKAISLS